MTTETTETHVITDVPAPKQRKLHNPFAKKQNAESTSDASEASSPKKKPLTSVYVAGALLVAAGAVSAAVSKLGAKADGAESTDAPTETPTTES